MTDLPPVPHLEPEPRSVLPDETRFGPERPRVATMEMINHHHVWDGNDCSCGMTRKKH